VARGKCRTTVKLEVQETSKQVRIRKSRNIRVVLPHFCPVITYQMFKARLPTCWSAKRDITIPVFLVTYI